MAAFSCQQTEKYTKPASSGTRRATAVKPGHPACLPTPLRAQGAQSGVKGHCPLLPLQKVAGLDDGVQTRFDVAAKKIKKGGAFAAGTNR